MKYLVVISLLTAIIIVLMCMKARPSTSGTWNERNSVYKILFWVFLKNCLTEPTFYYLGPQINYAADINVGSFITRSFSH